MAGHIAAAGNANWRTPDGIIVVVREFFGGEIDLDPCATPPPSELELAGRNVRLPQNGLEIEWGGSVYVNAPFGTTYVNGDQCVTPKYFKTVGDPEAWRKQTLSQWVEKARAADAKGAAETVILLPAAVDTAWWQRIILPSAPAICFIKGRVKFVGAPGPAPMACALAYFGDRSRRFKRFFNDMGFCA